MASGSITNINANLTLRGQSYVYRCEHIVNFRLLFTVNTAISGTFTELCRMPWKPKEVTQICLQDGDGLNGTYLDQTPSIGAGKSSIPTGDLILFGTYITDEV